MESRLIMLPNPILVSDEEIEKGDWFYYYSHGKFNMYMCEGVVGKNLVVQNKEPSYWSDYSKKIIAGIEGLPKLDLSAIAERIGWVDVERLANDHIYSMQNRKFSPLILAAKKLSFIDGFKTHQSLNEKKYSVQDVLAFHQWLRKKYGTVKPFEEGMIVEKCTAEQLVEKFLSKPKEYNVRYYKVYNTVTVTEIL